MVVVLESAHCKSHAGSMINEQQVDERRLSCVHLHEQIYVALCTCLTESMLLNGVMIRFRNGEQKKDSVEVRTYLQKQKLPPTVACGLVQGVFLLQRPDSLRKSQRHVSQEPHAMDRREPERPLQDHATHK